MSVGGEVVAEIAQGGFECPEDLVVGQIEELVGESLHEGVGLVLESGEELLPPCLTPFGGLVSRTRRFIQHGDHPGVRRTAAESGGSDFP
jgi:hypothetical protein